MVGRTVRTALVVLLAGLTAYALATGRPVARRALKYVVLAGASVLGVSRLSQSRNIEALASGFCLVGGGLYGTWSLVVSDAAFANPVVLFLLAVGTMFYAATKSA